MITHTRLEPDILECEVKWSLGNITMNKASGGGRIPVELLQILKDDAVKVLHSVQFSSSVISDSATPWTTARQASLSITNSRSPPKPMSIESGMPFNYLILCHPLLLLPSVFANIRIFSNESALPTQYVSKFGKLRSGHRTGKGQFSFQYQRKAMQNNTETASKLYPSHTLVK